MQIKNIILIILVVFMSACKQDFSNHLIAIDSSKSTGISKLPSFEKVLGQTNEGDRVVIMPIHGRTASAVSIIDTRIPECENINCKKTIKKVYKEIIKKTQDSFKNGSINSNVRLKTSILPIFSKMRRMESASKFQLVIISDMIEDNSSLNFSNQLPHLNKSDVKELALEKYNEWKDEIDINERKITILIPGTQSGSRNYNDEFHRKVMLFWETFIKEAGGIIEVGYLS